MKECNIELRDTWDGWEGENYDDLPSNEYRSDGPKRISITSKDDDNHNNCRLETDKYPLSEYNFESLAYSDSRIIIPKRYRNQLHTLIHEVVHFLQHNTLESDKAYFRLQKSTPFHYKQFVSQRLETEAYFIQLLFLSRYEQHLVKPGYLGELIKRITKSKRLPATRVNTILWAAKHSISEG